jgi:hypothetical protein
MNALVSLLLELWLTTMVYFNVVDTRVCINRATLQSVFPIHLTVL